MNILKQLKGFTEKERRVMDYNMREVETQEFERKVKGPKCPVCGGPLCRSIGRVCAFCGTVIRKDAEHE